MVPQSAAISREEKKVENKEVRILVVDDEPMMADSLRQNFMEEGYSVDTAATGAAAIELFDQGAHHLAICDLQLPDMDGLEVLRHMKDARPTSEVIVVTGYGTCLLYTSDAADERSSVDLGGRRIIKKKNK